MASKKSKEIEEALTAPLSAPGPLDPKTLLSTGSTLLDLALTGRPQGGLKQGHYYFWPGASSAGKTFWARTVMAEACQRKRFDDYRMIYDDVERGALMDTAFFYGERLASRLETIHSATTDDFYFGLEKLGDDGRPFIYVMDSMDALSSRADEEHFDARMEAWEAGKESKGSYGMAKAKDNSQGVRRLCSILEKTGSIVIIIGQLRDNVDPRSWENDVTTGGRALKFYATAQLFTRKAGNIEKEYLGKKRQQGIISRIQIKKNRLSGKEWEVQVPIYHSYGIDDIGSCVDWLKEEKHWTQAKGSTLIDAPEFGKMNRDKLIETIGSSVDNVRLMKTTVANVWQDIEEAVSIHRPKRYE